MKKEFIGIDLGSKITSIYNSALDKVVFLEPTCLLIDKKSKEVKEIGFLAEKTDGKVPFDLQVIHPVKNGIIEDDDSTLAFLERALKDSKIERKNKNLSVVISSPSICSKVNIKTLTNIAIQLGFKEIFIESQAKLAALGCNDDISSPTATLICHIGAGVSDIALLSMGEIVAAQTSFIAGDFFDETIRRYMIQKQHLNISLSSANYIKMKAGNINANSENRLVEIKGRDTITSLPSSVIVSSGELRNVLTPSVDIIIDKITDVISSVNPQLVSDLMTNGIILSGGSALLSGLKEYVKNALSIPVFITDSPNESVIKGFKKYASILNKKEK